MNEREIRILLHRYIHEEISDEEKERFLNLIASAENENTFKMIFSTLLEESDEDVTSVSKADSKRMFSNILSEINLSGEESSKQNISVFRPMKGTHIALRISIAAVMLIMFSLGFLLDKIMSKHALKDLPGTSFTEVISPYGSIARVNLPDGSQVELNAGSRIRYQSNFNKSNRDLSLEGEAYFKVAKNSVLPLNVSIGDLNIKAVGTEFNVKGYRDESVIETTLIEGKVEITQIGQNEGENTSVELIPNQKAIFNREASDFTLQNTLEKTTPEQVASAKSTDKILISPKVDIDQVKAWTEGKLLIRGENLEEICIKLQRKYDVMFIFNDEETKRFRFSGTLLDETLEQVLDAIKLSAPIDYFLSGKTVYLSTNRKASDDFSKYIK